METEIKMVEAGKYYKFKVSRKTDLGFMLKIDDEEILMHYRQSDKEYEIGDLVSAFIYYDKEGRFCATTIEVRASRQTPGFCEVVEVLPEGVFLDINTSKDVFLSSDYLPYNKALWPKVYDRVCVILKDKKKSLVAKIVNKEDLKKYSKNELVERESYKGFVVRKNEGGLGIVTESLDYVFVPNIMFRGNHRIGEEVNVMITKITDRDNYGSLILRKEKQMGNDKEIILNFMRLNNNQMPFTAKTSADIIESQLKMSRKAFKRAYGELYKERVINFDEEKTWIV